VLIVSQFTLYGDVRKGKRPVDAAAPPQQARELYFVAQARRYSATRQDPNNGNTQAVPL
jgi:D-Tyr-tRNAtyr deacylase